MFKKKKIQVLIDLNNKINAIILAFAIKLGLKVDFITVKVHKIDDSTFKMFKIVLIKF